MSLRVLSYAVLLFMHLGGPLETRDRHVTAMSPPRDRHETAMLLTAMLLTLLALYCVLHSLCVPTHAQRRRPQLPVLRAHGPRVHFCGRRCATGAHRLVRFV